MFRYPRGSVTIVLWFTIGIILGWRFYAVYHQPLEAVKEREPTKGTFLFVAILSSPKTTSLRAAARNTWLRLGNEETVTHRFFVGVAGLSNSDTLALENELRDHGDMVLLRDHRESYVTLSHKMLAIFSYVASAYKFDFLLKLDDDSLARLDVISRELLSRDEPELYWGFFAGNAPVFRTGKWAEPVWFLSDRYLPYARGGGYVLSAGLVRYMSENRHRLQAYKSEDVSVGVWLSGLIVKRVHDPRFDTEYRSRGCFNDYVVTHKQTVEMLYDKYESLTRDGVLCRNQVRWRRSYIYNWDVPPSQCCIRNNTEVH